MTPEVIAALNASVGAHLTAIETYTDFAACAKAYGFSKLADHWQGEADDERSHLARLLDRLEFLDAEENWEHLPPAENDDDPLAAVTAALSLEQAAAQIERDGYAAALAAGDPGSADVFLANLKASEESVYQLKGWLRAVERVGADNWLANQA